jgi:hypothetical protein
MRRCGSGCLSTLRIIPGAGSGRPTKTPVLRDGSSITRRFNDFGATKGNGYVESFNSRVRDECL